MYKKMQSDKEVIERIKAEFGDGWFSSCQIRIKISDLKLLAEKGYLECSKTVFNHLLIFRIIKKEKTDEGASTC